MTAKIAVSLPDHSVAEVLDGLDAEFGAPDEVLTDRADRALDALRE